MSKPAYPRLPVLLITGFLGSGKTTLLNRLLREWPRSAVLINEFGETPVDQQLLDPSERPLMVLPGGCLCCQVRGALAPTLKNLWMAWRESGGQAFDRLLIETSGIASPAPILDTLLRERWLAPRLDLQGVVCMLSALAAATQWEAFAEMQAQAAWADAIVLTHADVAAAGAVETLRQRLAAFAPGIPVLQAVQGDIAAHEMPSHGAASSRQARHWLAPTHGFHSLSLLLEQPVVWTVLQSALEALFQRYAGKLLRVKGVVYAPGQTTPWAVQGAAGRVYPPTPLWTANSGDMRGRLVFISAGEIEGLADDVLRALLE